MRGQGTPDDAGAAAAPMGDRSRPASEDAGSLPEWCAGVLEAIRDGLVIVDANWHLQYVNGAAESLLRMPREQVVGVLLWSLLPPERLGASLLEGLRGTMADGIERHLREVRPQGRAFRGRVFDLWIYPQPGGGIAILFEDVRERVQRESELARLATQAEEANRAKSRFFAAVSHELRTPLNAIVGYTHLLHSETYGELPGAARRAAERASLCAEHLADLIDDVLLMTTTELSRLPVVPALLDLAGFLREVTGPLRMQAEAKGLGFALVLEPGTPAVETDAARLRQLLLALVSNAIKFTVQGEVRVELRRARTAGAAVELDVVDTGPGIPKEDRERIFDAFEQLGDPSRTDSFTRGTGLGLTIARALAVLLQGELSVDENPDGGSVFRLRLPATPSAA